MMMLSQCSMCHDSKPERQLLWQPGNLGLTKFQNAQREKRTKQKSIAFQSPKTNRHTADTCHKDSRSIQSAPAYCNRQVGGELYVLTLANTINT